MVQNIIKIIIGILLPWLLFLIMGKLGAAFLALALQATIIGWIPASIWVLNTLKNEQQLKRKANKS